MSGAQQRSLAEKVFLIHGARQNIRADGRPRDAFRPISIDVDVLDNCNGSARVRIGATDVLVAVKAEMTPVEEDALPTNRLVFSVDFSVVADVSKSETFQNVIADALSTAYDNEDVLPGLRQLPAPATHNWTLFVDTTVLCRDGGNLIDTISLGAKAAISSTRISVVRLSEKQVVETGEVLSLDASSAPLVVAVNKMGGHDVLDVSGEEESCVKAALWIGVVKAKEATKVTLLQQIGCLDNESVREMMDFGIQAVEALEKSLAYFECTRKEAEEPEPIIYKHALLSSF